MVMNDFPDTELDAGLYIVATPIGNLGDLSSRARSVLARADIVAVEDSRVTGRLLNHLGIKARMRAYHDFSDASDREHFVEAARNGPVALVSDAGTPLISDPGYKLVRACRDADVMVTTLPGPSAAIAALTISGLPTDRFLFAGFLPNKAGARDRELTALGSVDATLIFYESGHRIAATLAAVAAIMGEREVAVAREITKKFEQVLTGSAAELAERIAGQPLKGEIVLIVGPPGEDEAADETTLDDALVKALDKLSPSQAAAEVARAFGADRKLLYKRALELKGRGG